MPRAAHYVGDDEGHQDTERRSRYSIEKLHGNDRIRLARDGERRAPDRQRNKA